MPVSAVHGPELLAPAGDWEAMRAAVANGADAVYFGLDHFNARARAANIKLAELPEFMAYLHAHNVRGYVTLNTLIFSDELPEAVEFLKAIAGAGADAVIVQDLGIAFLCHRLCPTLEIHASTQMTLTEAQGIELIGAMGIKRVIIARELSIADLRAIARQTSMPLEVFVHGALCVSYSGQCLTSEALGGRSANRGQCAQACRLPYDLVVDGGLRDVDELAYLLSPQDLAAYDRIAELAGVPVRGFKIEGRLKSAQYVAATTNAYRLAIDAAIAGKHFEIPPEAHRELAQSFSRGFTHGFLDGSDHRRLVQARFPKSRGLYIGRIVGKTAKGLLVELFADRHGPAELKAGDGVVFDEGHPEQDEQGGRIFTVTRARNPKVLEILMVRGAVNLAAVAIGSMVWKTDDPALRRKLEQSYRRERVVRLVPLTAHVEAVRGKTLVVLVCDDEGHQASVSWDKPLEEAHKFPLTLDIFREQFGRLGGTPFELAKIEVAGGAFDSVMVPKSVLNDLRRQAVGQLLELRSAQTLHHVVEPNVLEALRSEIVASWTSVSPLIPCPAPGRTVGMRGEPQTAGHDVQTAISPSPSAPRQGSGGGLLYVLVRTDTQLDAVLEWLPPPDVAKPAMIYCEFEDVRRYKSAVQRARQALIPIGLATLRVLKPGESGLLRQLAICEPDAILVRNLGAIAYFRRNAPDLQLVGDYALNIANEIAAQVIASYGLKRFVPSYDLNWDELSAMVRRFGAASFEAVVHQHMPMFHTEHCVFSHTLTGGADHRTCGRPCEAHRLDLRDRASVVHPLIADVGCRNTVYNGTAQSAAEFVRPMRDLGLRHFRVELLREDAAAAISLLTRYARVLSGADDGRTTWRQLRVLNQLGVTRGTMGKR